MPTDNKAISVTYSDEKLRILVEEFITMQRRDFSFKSLCSFVLYRAMEEGRTSNTGLYQSNELQPIDRERLYRILDRIKEEGRIAVILNSYDSASATCCDEIRFSIISK